MKFATNRGYRIAYEVFGQGPAVVLQHGFMSTRQSWKVLGFVGALADDFTVIAIDSIGHGDSDKPVDAVCYSRKTRVDDIAVVLDAEAVGKAHYVGYSMGGWLGIGVLAHRPDRLLSLTVGGFDPAQTETMMPGLTAEQFLEGARSVVPQAVAWVTPEAMPGLTACLAALRSQDVPVDVLVDSILPVNLWTGAEDTCFESLKDLHGKMPNSTFSVVPGDHAGTMTKSNKVSADAIHRFLINIPEQLD